MFQRREVGALSSLACACLGLPILSFSLTFSKKNLHMPFRGFPQLKVKKLLPASVAFYADNLTEKKVEMFSSVALSVIKPQAKQHREKTNQTGMSKKRCCSKKERSILNNI